ncbi:hypothetical protein [Nitratidesulfovibrio vulgaris]|uniref:Uncharacterized protein n=1 Tax=Nitratidesulfovibrio vulgaris (strain DP4) TaxID=391774 RepID=A0A0H3A8S6_NITV4|nr:hypothetical protein [Nitratidesulfovibrio vulgaris]ABM28501.1 hypothetical protein Dvul_1483 [Nitratidesulfovibrio vulgaris DP4]
METRPAEADQGKTQYTIGRDRLHRLLAIWSMLSGVPEDALRCQTETMFGLEGEDADNPVRVHAAGEYVLRMNAVLLEKGARVSAAAAGAYMRAMGVKPEEPELVSVFWQEFERLQQLVGGLDHSRTPARIAINLNQFLRLSDEHAGPGFDSAELKEALRTSQSHVLLAVNRCVHSRRHGKVYKCWVFERGDVTPVSADD